MAAPINDTFDNRLLFTTSFDEEIVLDESTFDSEEEALFGSDYATGMVWIQFSNVNNGTLTLHITDVPVSGVGEITIFLGNSIDALTEVQYLSFDSGNDLTYTLNTSAGVKYQIEINTYETSYVFNLQGIFVSAYTGPRYGIRCGQVQEVL